MLNTKIIPEYTAATQPPASLAPVTVHNHTLPTPPSTGAHSPDRFCVQCGRTQTPLWRRHPTNSGYLCNACGLYLKQKQKYRPPPKQGESHFGYFVNDHFVESQDGIVVNALGQPPNHIHIQAFDRDQEPGKEGETQCFNCGTVRTPLWRKDEDGKIMCNACTSHSNGFDCLGGLYLKLHGRHRPMTLRNRRRRISYHSLNHANQQAQKLQQQQEMAQKKGSIPAKNQDHPLFHLAAEAEKKVDGTLPVYRCPLPSLALDKNVSEVGSSVTQTDVSPNTKSMWPLPGTPSSVPTTRDQNGSTVVKLTHEKKYKSPPTTPYVRPKEIKTPMKASTYIQTSTQQLLRAEARAAEKEVPKNQGCKGDTLKSLNESCILNMIQDIPLSDILMAQTETGRRLVERRLIWGI